MYIRMNVFYINIYIQCICGCFNTFAANPTFNRTPTCPNNDMSSQISCMKGMIGIMMLHSMQSSHAFQQSQR